MSERVGRWQQISRCRECGYIIAKEEKWVDGFFVRVCPGCGSYNSEQYGYTKKGIFDGVTARRVATRWGRFLRWEFKEEMTVPESRKEE